MLWHSHDTGPPVIHAADISQNVTEVDDVTRVVVSPPTQLTSEHQRRRHLACSKKQTNNDGNKMLSISSSSGLQRQLAD